MLYLLPLLFAVSYGADCNKIVYESTAAGITTRVASLVGPCQIAGTTSTQYKCNDAGDDVDYYVYSSSADCSGDATTVTEGLCGIYGDDCTATCDGSECTGFTFTTYLDNEDCSGDPYTSYNYIADECVGSSTLGTKYTCSAGEITVSTYTGSLCEGDATTSTPFATGCIGANGVSAGYEGCDSSSNTLQLFGAIMAVFIASLF